MKIAFLINGTAKGLTKLTKSIEITFKEFEPKLFISEKSGDIFSLAHTAISRGYDTIIVCGGDIAGTDRGHHERFAGCGSC